MTSTTLADSDKSDGDVVSSFRNSTCVLKLIGDTPDCVSADDPEERLLLVTEDSFATDRKTAMAVNDASTSRLTRTSTRVWSTSGRSTRRRRPTRTGWDNTIRRSVDAEYVGEEDVEGTKTQMYHVDIVEQPAEVTSGVQGEYSSDKTIWVEPVTGRIVKQAEHQVRVGDAGDNVLELEVTMTPETSKRLVSEAADSKGLLNLLGTWVPLLGLLIGVPALIAALLLVRRTHSAA